MITKKSSYSPPQRLPVAPAKAFVNRRVNSYDVDGRCCNFSEAPRHNENFEIVKLRDCGYDQGEH